MAPAHRLIAAGVTLALSLAGCGSDAPAPQSSAHAPATPADVRVGRQPNTPFIVTPTDLGIHSFTTRPEVPTGTIRMTCWPTWAATNPAPGSYDWSDFDALLARAELWGYSDILYVFCGTPRWAGRPVQGTDRGAFGPGTAQPPADMADWDVFVRSVVERYRGRISGYEVWNEPSSAQFFTGTPEDLAEMTARAEAIIGSVDPDAYVVAGSTQTHAQALYEPFFDKYLRDLADRQWPVDALAAHFIPPAGGGPDDRVARMRQVLADVDAAGAPPELPLWDTEVNYAVGGSTGRPDGRITGGRAAAWTVRTYLDAWRSGVRRTYWYLWSAEYYGFPGIQMRPGDPSTQALGTFGEWVIGVRFDGCRSVPGSVVCAFRDPEGDFTVAWAKHGTVVMATDAMTACPVYGSPCRSVHGGNVRLSAVPVRLQ